MNTRALSLLLSLSFSVSVLGAPLHELEGAPSSTKKNKAKKRPKKTSEGRRSEAGLFAEGKTTFSLGGGLTSVGEARYFSLQGQLGYFMFDGLSAQLGVRAWLPLDDTPSLYTLSPGVSYYLYQLKPIIPYAGLFYEHTFTDLPLASKDAWGGRAGLLWNSSGLLLGFGVRLTRPFECAQAHCDLVEPELTVLFSF